MSIFLGTPAGVGAQNSGCVFVTKIDLKMPSRKVRFGIEGFFRGQIDRERRIVFMN
ncbi:MAG: hypothetical protein Kow0042_01330 [Calditrichia bacterium]